MLFGLDPKLIGDLLLATLSLGVEILYYGVVQNKMLYLDLVQNLILDLWHDPHVRLCGYVTS